MCPVIAIGGQLPVGPGYINTEEEAWKADVVLLMRHAGMILVLPAATAGMEFEIAHILAQDYLPKTLFLGPPTARDTEPWEVTWRKMTVQLERHGLDVPEYRPSGMAFHYLPEQTTAVVQELSGDIGNLEQLRQFVVSAIT